MPGKMMEKVVQGGIGKNLEYNAVTGHKQRGFRREKVLVLKIDCLL